MNFTAAARELHITQPAVSQHIHFLENEYQTTLFEYHNKQLSLTPAGEVLKRRLTSMKNDEKNIQLEIRSLSNRIESLSIGVTMTIGEYAIVDRCVISASAIRACFGRSSKRSCLASPKSNVRFDDFPMCRIVR